MVEVGPCRLRLTNREASQVETWQEVTIGVVVVIVASLLFNFGAIPLGAGKIGAYLAAAFLPTVIIQYRKVADDGARIATGEFVFALVMNSFMICSGAMLLLAVIGRV